MKLKIYGKKQNFLYRGSTLDHKTSNTNNERCSGEERNPTIINVDKKNLVPQTNA